MSKMTHKLRITMLKGMEALGTTAANLASNAKLRVNELNLETRRREILTDFSLQAFELWQKGVQLPEPLADMLKELCEIESRLNVLRAQKYAKVAGETTAKPDDATAPACAAVGGEAAALAGEAVAGEAQQAAEAPAAVEAAPVAEEAPAAESLPSDSLAAESPAEEASAREADENVPPQG